MTFTEAKQEFDNKYGTATEYNCFLPEHLTFGRISNFKKKNGQRNEQYYKWQFLYSIIQSRLYAKDYIGGFGEYVGIAGFYNFVDFGHGHHNQGMYRVLSYKTHKLLFMLCFLNCSLMRKYCAGLSVGSKMKELKIEQFVQIPFPNFEEQKQKEIALLYHNPESIYPIDTFTLNNFLEQDNDFNKTAGIYELDKTAKQLKAILNKAIDDIANDREVSITFKTD